MKEGFKDKFFKWFAISLVVAIFLGGLYFAWPKFNRFRALTASNAEAQQKIDAERAEIAKLVEKQRRFHTDRDFVEMIARQSRRVYPGELVFIFGDEKNSKKK